MARTPRVFLPPSCTGNENNPGGLIRHTGRGTVEQTSPCSSPYSSELLVGVPKWGGLGRSRGEELGYVSKQQEFCPGHVLLQALGVEFEWMRLEVSPWKGWGLQKSLLLLKRTWTTLEMEQFLVCARKWF